MAEYTNEFGDIYDEDEINQFAQDQETTIEDIIQRNGLVQADQEELPGKPKKKSTNKQKAVVPQKQQPINGFGKIPENPLGAANVPSTKPKAKVKPVEQPSLWDDAVGLAKSLFPDSEDDGNGKLTYYEQTPIKVQQQTFNQDSKDAMNATGKFEFLKDYKPEDRALFISKLLPKTNYTEKKYNQETNEYEVKPKQEAIDYVKSDINPKDFKTQEQLDQAIALNVKKLASQDSAFEFEQNFAKAKAAPLIKQKAAEIQKKYKLDNPTEVEKATKELQNYAAKTTTDFLINSQGFQSLNKQFSEIENGAKQDLTKSFGRGKDTFLSAMDFTKNVAEASKAIGGPVGEVIGRGLELGAKNLESGIKGAQYIGQSVKQSIVSANHNSISNLNSVYSNIKDKPDSAPIDKAFAYEWEGSNFGAFNPKEQDTPKTYGEAKDRLKKYLDKTNSLINNRVKSIEESKKYIGLFNQADLKDGIQLDDIFQLIGEQVPNMALTAAGAVTANPAIIGLSAANMFTQAYGNQYYSAIETGLKEDLGREPNEKEIAKAIGEGKYADRGEAAAWSALSAAAEFAGELNVIKNTGKALGIGNDAKTVLGSLFRGEIKNFGKSAVSNAKAITSSALGEDLTERFQTAVDQISMGTQVSDDAKKYINLKEINEAGEAARVVGFVIPFGAAVKTQSAIELKAAAVKVATSFDLSNKDINNLVQVDNFFKAASNNINERFKVGDITEAQKQSELETLGTIRSAGTKIPSNFSEDAKKQSLDLILEKANIEKEIEGKDKDLVAPEVSRLKDISAELAVISIGEKVNIPKDVLSTIEIDIERTKVALEKLGLSEDIEFPELNTSEEVINYLNENTKDIDENEKKRLSTSYGLFVPLKNGKQALIINKEEAEKDRVVTTGQHEFLHKLIYKAIANNKFLQKKIGTDLYNHIENYLGGDVLNNTEFKKRYDGYKNQFEKTKTEVTAKTKSLESYFTKGQISEESYNDYKNKYDEILTKAEGKYLEETLPLLSEALTSGDIKYNENFFTKLGDIIRRIFQKYGIKKISFETGKDVFNFVRDYNKSFESGEFNKAFKGLAKEGKVSGIKPTLSGEVAQDIKESQAISKVDQFKQELKDLEEEYDEGFGDISDEEYNSKKANIQIKIKAVEKLAEKAPIKEEKVKEVENEDEEDVKKIIKEEKGSLPSSKVQDIYNERGIAGASSIIKLFKPITKRIVDKRRDAPGFDRELLTDEIETGVGGILDLIQKYNPESGVPLAAYINKYLPVRAIATSRRILEGDFKKDVTEEKGLMAEETVSETKEKPKYKNALESKVFEPEVIKTMQDKIIVQLRTLKSRIDEPISLNRTVTPLIAEIVDAIGKQLDIDVKKAMGGKKDGELVKWLLKNKRYVLENMTTTWLMGANGQGGIPQAIQKQIDGKWVNYPDWVDKKIDRETVSTDNAGRTSGAELVRRLPNVFNNISDIVYLSQVVGPDGNPIRGRKESLGKAVAVETALDIVNKDLIEEGVISDVLIANQERLGAEIKENFANEIARQTERGNIKQSEKLIRGVEVSLELLNDNLLEAKTIEDEVKVVNNWIASSGRSLRTLASFLGGKLKKYTTNKGLFEEIVLKAIKARSKFEGELISDTAYRLGDVKKGKSIFFGNEKVFLFQDIDEIKKNWVKNVKTINEQSLQATEQFVDDIKKFKNNKKYNKYDFESYIELLRQDQRGLIRKLSKAGMAVINLARGTKTLLEHNHTIQKIVNKTIEFYDGKINEKEFREFLNKGVVNLMPKDVEELMPKQPIADENRMFAPDVILKIQEYLDKGATLYNVEAEYGSRENFDALAKLSKSGLNSEQARKEFEDIRKIADRLNIKESTKMPKEQLSAAFNDIIQDVSGMENYKVFSDIVARRRGSKKNRLDLYVPPSAADFELLLYNFMGKGKKGEEQKKFFEEALLVPYTEGNILMDAARQAIKREYKKLLNAFPDINKKLESLTPDKDFTYDQAIRVAMWNEGGKDIPGLSERDERKLTNLVNDNPELKAFKEGLTIMGRQGIGWVNPTEYWDASTIISDLHNLTEGDGRKKFLGEFIDNVEALFGKFKDGRLDDPNMNKIEAVYGTNVREALEDVIYRMISGKNKSFGKDKETTRWSNWVNGSTGAIMFLNTRSAALQLIGAVNFLNFRDNNPYAAAKAFANQPQYWKDFAKIWNSDKMKERRGGLKEDVAAAEIANAAATSKNKVGAVLSYLLKIGYTPTQLADSFAIASGGAPFYRNRIKSYIAEGLSEEEAEHKAWNDFSKVSDETQQSGDPRDISKQQASAAGRLLLTFQNTAMQQSRIVKKAVLDLKNGRGDVKTNISKIAYYIAIQNIMFSVLQQGLFAVAFSGDDGGDDEDKEKQKAAKTKEQKIIGLADDVLDTILRGTGFLGGITATTKNMILKYIEEKEKKQSDYAKVVLEGTNISPPIGSKLKKLYSGLNQTKYDKDLIEARGWGVMQDGRVHLGPMYSITGQVVEATTNIPMGRFVNKIENVSQSLNSQNEAWQRIMIGLGWSPFSVGIKENEADAKIKEAGKALRKEEGIKKAAEERQRKKDSIRQLPLEDRIRIKKEDAVKRRTKRKERIEKERRLRRLGTSTK